MKEYKEYLEQKRKAGEKDIYRNYGKTTQGIDEYFANDPNIFRQSTNPTKSKYDNVVGFLR